MPEQVQAERLRAGDVAVKVSHHQPQLLFVTAVLCLLSSWYFAVAIAPAGLGASAPGVRQGLFPEWSGCRQCTHGGHGGQRYHCRCQGVFDQVLTGFLP
jgi:hypothetical protein